MTGNDTRPADAAWTREEIESPCVRVCVLHPTERLCMGCHRTGAEIAAWSRLAPEARRAVLDELPSRAARLEGARPPRRGGRAARLGRDR